MQDNTFQCECCTLYVSLDNQVTVRAEDIVDGKAWCDPCNTDTCSPSGEFCMYHPTARIEWEEDIIAELELEEQEEEIDALRHEQLIADAVSLMELTEELMVDPAHDPDVTLCAADNCTLDHHV